MTDPSGTPGTTGSRSGGTGKSGSFTSADQRQRVKRLFEPVALFFGRLGLTPNGLTLLGFGSRARSSSSGSPSTAAVARRQNAFRFTGS